jgi:hypothetical protein
MGKNLETPTLNRKPVELPAVDVAGGTPEMTVIEHSLGVVPSQVTVRLRAKTDAGNGVTRGMELDVFSMNSGADNGAWAVGGVWLTDRKVHLGLYHSRVDIVWPDGTTSDSQSFTAATWEWVVRVWP